MPVNQENVQLLITELRAKHPDGTPVYRKGRGYLHQILDGEDLYCCLGVASVVAAEHGVQVSRRISENYAGIVHETFSGIEQEVLCDEVKNFYGFDDHNPNLDTPGGHRIPAAEWNDYGMDGDGRDGASPPAEEDFEAIADGFERTFLDGK